VSLRDNNGDDAIRAQVRWLELKKKTRFPIEWPDDWPMGTVD
jgi:hypothetical protein